MGITDTDEIELNLRTGTISKPDGTISITGKPLSQVQRDIYFAGGLLEIAGK